MRGSPVRTILLLPVHRAAASGRMAVSRVTQKQPSSSAERSAPPFPVTSAGTVVRQRVVKLP